MVEVAMSSQSKVELLRAYELGGFKRWHRCLAAVREFESDGWNVKRFSSCGYIVADLYSRGNEYELYVYPVAVDPRRISRSPSLVRQHLNRWLYENGINTCCLQLSRMWNRKGDYYTTTAKGDEVSVMFWTQPRTIDLEGNVV